MHDPNGIIPQDFLRSQSSIVTESSVAVSRGLRPTEDCRGIGIVIDTGHRAELATLRCPRFFQSCLAYRVRLQSEELDKLRERGVR